MALNRKTFKKAAAGAAADTNLPSGYFNTVTYTGNGSTQRVGGYINRGAVFNGSSSGINTPIPFLNAKVTSSVSLWVRYTDTAAYKTLFQDWSSNNNWNHNIIVNQPSTGNVRFFSAYGGSSGYEIIESSGLTLNDGNWHHIVSTVDLSTNTLTGYVDGVSVGNVTVSTNSWTGVTQNANIGNENGTSNFFNGSIDQVRIFDKALSSGEVTTLYGETHASTTKSTTDIFSDNSGVALYQLDGNANDTGGVSGYIGEGAIFNGSSSIITNTNQVIPNGAASFSFWYNPSGAAGVEYIIGSGVATASKGISVAYIGSTGIFAVYVLKGTTALAANFSGTTAYSNTDWHNISVTWDGTTASNAIKLYVNGSLEAQGTSDTSSASIGSYTTWGMGGQNGGVYAKGKIDQVRIYSKALSSSEVTTLYGETASSNITISDLVAYYPMEGTSLDQEGSYHGTDTNVEYNYNGTASNVTYQEATNFSPDLVWTKQRSSPTRDHLLNDSVRGANKILYPNLTNAEDTAGGVGSAYFNSFDSNGFTVGSSPYYNGSGLDYVAWCFKGGGAAVSGTSSQATSVTMSPNPDAGFSIVKFTSSASAPTPPPMNYISHGLTAAPEMVIYKRLDSSQNWVVQHKDLNQSTAIYLDLSNGVGSPAAYTFFDNDATNIGVRSNFAISRDADYIAYCFHSVDGIQKVGSYTGNGGSVNVETGFEPAWIMIKRTDAVEDWKIIDNKRDNFADSLEANESIAEENNNNSNFIPTSNGFQMNDTHGDYNASGGTYIYLAIAADPDTTTPTVEDSFEVVTYTGNGGTQSIDTGFKPDLIWVKQRAGSAANHLIFDSIRGAYKQIMPNTTSSGVDRTSVDKGVTSFDSNGFTVKDTSAGDYEINGPNGGTYSGDGSYVAWCWKAGDHDDNLPQINTEGTIDSVVSVNDAAGFSIVKWTGTGSNATVGHGLSSAPEIRIIKGLSTGTTETQNWFVWVAGIGTNNEMILNGTGTPVYTASVMNQNQSPTSTTFPIGNDARINQSGKDYIAYCFTSITGYQKIGSYTGTGVTGNTVTTGFRPRFVILKGVSGTSATTNWTIVDSVRDTGTVIDKIIYANKSDAEVDFSNARAVEFTDTGFELYSTGSDDLNDSSTTYIYLAIA